jgi:hypothetical protein
MKNAHRKTHMTVWILLVPLLGFILFSANDARQQNRPVIEMSSDAERGGLLP